MLEAILTLLHGAVLLTFGIALSVAFAGIRFSKQNFLVFLGLFLGSGALQVFALVTLSDELVWKLYPLITHLPLIALLSVHYRKTLATALSSVFTAYMCCQPAKWLGVITRQATGSGAVEFMVRIACLLAVGYFIMRYCAPCLAAIYSKEPRNVYIFGIVPTVYYLFDYLTGVYTDLMLRSNPIVAEFLPFFLFFVYLLFCLVYYQQYEQKADAERKEQIIRIITQQQDKELSLMKQGQQEIRLLRHDMRLLLGNLTAALEEENLDHAKKMISAYADTVDKITLRRYCENDSLNYILSHFASRCEGHKITFRTDVRIDAPLPDEVLFASILSNALDNALNAQLELPVHQRLITLMLKNSDGRLLLSVKNPFRKTPVFSDGLPVSTRKGHGYGAQSIRYMTDRLGGNCQFSIQKDMFVLRVII